MSGRYAVYYVPDFQSQLYRLGSALLGRCVETGAALPRPELKNIYREELVRHTRRASLYGFHGTIVAPFETEAESFELESLLATIARASEPFILNGLRLTVMDKTFAALTPESGPEQLARLESQCVKAFSPFRLPLAASDLARRGPLSPKLRANLINWGYHLVFDEFKFHLTVADSLPDLAGAFLAALESYLEPVLNRPLVFDRLALFHQRSWTEPFICLKVFLLKDMENER